MSRMNCPACSAPNMIVIKEGMLECQYCGTNLMGTYSACPTCGHLNALGLENCTACGEPLTIISQIITRHTSQGEPLRLKQVRSQASAIKKREARTSKLRMEAFQEIDRRREQAQAEAKEVQEVHQRRVSTILLIVSALFIVFVILFIISSLLS